MIYTLIINKKSYDLPKRTIDVVERMDAVLELDSNPKLSTRQKYQAILDFETELLGEESIEQILGGTDLSKMDVSDIILMFKQIVDAYNKPVQDYARATSKERFRDLPMEELGQLAGVLDKVQNLHD